MSLTADRTRRSQTHIPGTRKLPHPIRALPPQGVSGRRRKSYACSLCKSLKQHFFAYQFLVGSLERLSWKGGAGYRILRALRLTVDREESLHDRGHTIGCDRPKV